MTAPMLTEQAWRTLIDLAQNGPRAPTKLERTFTIPLELLRAGVMHSPHLGTMEATPVGLVAYGRLAHALENMLR